MLFDENFDYETPTAKIRQIMREFNDFHSLSVKKRGWEATRNSPEFHTFVATYREADAQCYPPEFWKDYWRLRDGLPPDLLEPAIRFLEVKPDMHRAVSLYRVILRKVKQYNHTPEQKSRLQRVVLNAIDCCYYVYFKEIRRLALKLDDSAFREQLRNRVNSKDKHIRRRAEWVLSVFPKAV